MLEDNEDKPIFMVLHDEYSSVMYNKAYAILKDSALAEDVVQESFIRIIKNFDKVIKKKCPQTRKYFVNIVRTISIDVYRKNKKQQNPMVWLCFDRIKSAVLPAQIAMATQIWIYLRFWQPIIVCFFGLRIPSGYQVQVRCIHITIGICLGISKLNKCTC